MPKDVNPHQATPITDAGLFEAIQATGIGCTDPERKDSEVFEDLKPLFPVPAQKNAARYA